MRRPWAFDRACLLQAIDWLSSPEEVGAGSLCVPGTPLRGQATAIRRRMQRGLKLAPELELIEGDVVVLLGTAVAVTVGEDVLLRGKQK